MSLFLEATPLVAVATALTTHTIYRNLVWGLVIIAITMMLGRVWCNWMCPFGILHHLFGWIGNRRNTKQMIEVNRYRKIYAIKYYILAAMLAMASLWIIPTVLDAPADRRGLRRGRPRRRGPDPDDRQAFGLSWVGRRWRLAYALLGLGGQADPVTAVRCRSSWASAWSRGGVPGAGGLGRRHGWSAEEHKAGNSTLQIGLLDPIALTVRSMTTSVLPTVHKATEGVYTEPREYWFAWVVGLIFIGFLVANWWIPRFFCRAICPLGALLGVFSRFALWRIDRDPVRCTDCDLCLKSCEGASDPHRDLRKSECFVCFNCIEDCPHDALSFRFLPRKASEVAAPGGRPSPACCSPACSACSSSRWPGSPAASGRTSTSAVIRPPGSVAEDEFLRRCIKCDQCIRVCPTNVLQPATVRGRRRGALDADHDLQDGLVRAELHAVQPGLPHRRDPRDLDRREARHRPVRGQGADQDRHRVLQPRPLPALGDGHRAASSARRSARSAPRRSSPATSRSPTAGARRSN